MHKRTKVNIAIFVLLVGMACMFTAVVTDYWAVLSPRMTSANQTCEAAHFGLWRLCKKHIYIDSEHFVEGKGCGPISLPGGEFPSGTIFPFGKLLDGNIVCLCVVGRPNAS